jgi:hypothetical protein
MTRRPLLDLRRIGGLRDGPLHRRVGPVGVADGPAARIFRERGGGKDVLPPPLGRGIRIFFLDRVGQGDPADPFGTVGLVLGLPLLQVAPERIVEALRQHRCPVLATLPIPHVDAPVIEVKLLDPKAERFRQPQPAPVQQMRDQAIRAKREGCKEPLHLVAREHRGEALGALGAVERPNVGQFEVEHLFVDEDQRIEGLVLGGGRHVAIRREVVQEGPDVVFVEAAGMGGVVKVDEAFGPAHVGLFRVVAILAPPTGLSDLIEEFGRLVAGTGHDMRRSG